MGYQWFTPHDVVSLAKVHLAESATPLLLASVAEALLAPFRDNRDGAKAKAEDTAAKIPEAAAGTSERDHRMTGCCASAEHYTADRKELASA